MVEDLEEKSGEGFDVQRILGIVRRRHLEFLIPLFLGWLLVWVASWALPPKYQSTTLILVEQPTMPKDYVTPNVTDDLQERLQSITQQILSRTRLLRIIDQFNLYNSAHGNSTPDEKVERMRKDIDIALVRDERSRITAFDVSYAARNPHMAQQVTSELTNLFINENLEVRQRQSEDTTAFLETQLETARKDLADQENRIRQFKAEHVGEMQEQQGSNLQILQGVQSQLQNEEDSLNAARQQRVYLQTLSDQYRTLQVPTKGDDGTSAGLPALEQQLQKLRAQYADLSSHYTERHPDVRKLRDEIAKTERLLAASKNKPADESASGSDASNPLSQDPAQASRLAPIESQLKSNQLEITNREHAINVLKAKVDDYQGRLNQEPIHEQQLADLTRGYDQRKSSYDDLLKKRNDSQMATSMELLQQGERFRVMDPPSLPQKPAFPNRLKFCGIGLAFGLVLGGLVAGIFEVLDDRLHQAKEIRKLLPTEVIGEIPTIVNASDLKTAQRKMRLGWVTAGVVFASIVAGSAISFLRG